MDAENTRWVFPIGARAPKHERSFDLALPALVQGQHAQSGTFSETAEVASLSAEEAVLRLESPVTYGTKLRLCLRIPPTSLLEAPLELSLSGMIRSVGSEMPGQGRRRLISVRLDRVFRIQPVAP